MTLTRFDEAPVWTSNNNPLYRIATYIDALPVALVVLRSAGLPCVESRVRQGLIDQATFERAKQCIALRRVPDVSEVRAWLEDPFRYARANRLPETATTFVQYFRIAHMSIGSTPTWVGVTVEVKVQDAHQEGTLPIELWQLYPLVVRSQYAPQDTLANALNSWELPIRSGDYVLVHAGQIIEVIPPNLYRELYEDARSTSC